ncbi:hypothetical protein Q7C36_014702 [Tachysurus vachellii]|uniref:Immunoglobulin domain-containing protein n=1 Tax=Tachysurus vachellii TaxID=175792 RepID=A0AA88SJK3_TACVA|nr:hypothetical protein Q7C36_014702 [Tachysurus vachellii]
MKVQLVFILLSCANSIFTEFQFDLKSISTVIVSENETVTLRCDITGNEEVAWYHLNSTYMLKLLISAQKTRMVKSLPVYYNVDKSRFILRPDSEINTAEFTINNINGDNLGLYFCGTTAKPAQMHFNNATRLKFKGKSEGTTPDE